MEKGNKRIVLGLIGILTTMLLTGFLLSCTSTSDAEIADNIKSSISSSGVKDVTVAVTDRGVQIIAGGLNFPPDSAEVVPDTAQKLDKIGMVIKEYKDKQILIEGHTADIGDMASQKTLSRQRAKAVADYLLSKGAISAGKFTIEGMGGSMPLSSDTSEAGLAKNRRVEIIILH